MKLLQLNVWGGRLEYQIGDLLAEENPDIVCLQESISFDPAGSGLFITVEQIQEKYNLPYIAFEPTFSFNFMHKKARFGNCVISRYPIIQSNAVFTHLEHVDNFTYGETSNMRNFVHTTIETPGKKPCHVITHHGFWIPSHKNGNEETMASIKILADYIKVLEGPIIVTGDFNLSPKSESIQQINNLLLNLCDKYEVKTTRNSLTHKNETCDYIFISDQVTDQGFSVSDKIVSDHQALFLNFSV